VVTLAGVFGQLLAAGATIIVIDHDLDLLAAADHVIDMGPGGGLDGGRIVAAGTPADVARVRGSVTGRGWPGTWARRRRPASPVSRCQRRANHHDRVMSSHLARNEPGRIAKIRTAKQEDNQ
jgi:energy-coupling factor transporter ATP-binding protein EcfA2